jgi:predicted RNase H-like HicB family nuclease
MEIKRTAVFRKFPGGHAAFVEELPGANTQGAALDEARENLKEAVAIASGKSRIGRRVPDLAMTAAEIIDPAA